MGRERKGERGVSNWSTSLSETIRYSMVVFLHCGFRLQRPCESSSQKHVRNTDQKAYSSSSTHTYTSNITRCESLQGYTLASLRQGYLYPHPDQLTRTEPRVFLLLEPACDEPVVVLLPLLLLLQLLYQPRVPFLLLLLLARRLQGSTAK